MGDSVGEKIKASGKTVVTGEKDESGVGGSKGRGVSRPSLQSWSGMSRGRAVGNAPLRATIDDSWSKSSTTAGGLWRKQKPEPLLQPFLEITCPGTPSLGA